MNQMQLVIPDKSLFVDNMGRPITQSLFLEIGYTDSAVYTLKDDHFLYNGRYLPALKLLYMQEEDPTEYLFANKYLLNWKHWKRMNENKILRKHFDEWREELELKLRCRAVQQTMEQAKKGSFNAARWLADRGWEKRGAGRPSRNDVIQQEAFEKKVGAEFSADVLRLFND